MIQHNRQQQDAHERTVHKDHFGHYGAMDQRFLGATKGGSDPVFPVKTQQAGDASGNKICQEEQTQDAGAQ